MLTAEKRIRDLGYALLGVCRENFMQQAHNKREYVNDGSAGVVKVHRPGEGRHLGGALAASPGGRGLFGGVGWCA